MTAVFPAFDLEAPARVARTSSWRRWRYTGGRRDQRLDFLRGFAGFAMIVDHVSGSRSWLYLITGGDVFYVSAAEAFVFISGLVMGIVYRDIINRDGIAAAIGKSLRRAWTLYALTVALTLSFAAISSLLGLPWAPHLAPAGVLAFVIGAVTLHQTYHLADVLLMYTFLVAGAGPVLALFATGRTRWALIGSWGLWLLWQVAPAQAQIPWPIPGNVTFPLAAWQAVFVTGMALGYHRRLVEERLGRLPQSVALAVSGFVVVAAAIIFFGVLGNGPLGTALFGKPDLRIGRVIVFAAAFSLAFIVTTIAWLPLRRIFGWLLLPLGHQALSAYTLHIFVVAALWKWAPLLWGANPSATQNALIELAGVGVVWAAIVVWPEMTSFADCCVHCRRSDGAEFGRFLWYGRPLGAGSTSGIACTDGAVVADADPGFHGRAPVCGHSDRHEHCP